MNNAATRDRTKSMDKEVEKAKYHVSPMNSNIHQTCYISFSIV